MGEEIEGLCCICRFCNGFGPFFESPCSSEAAAFEPFPRSPLSLFDISQRCLTLPERCRDAPCVCVNEATVSSVPAGAPPTLGPGRAVAHPAAKRKKTNKTSRMRPGAARSLSLPPRRPLCRPAGLKNATVVPQKVSHSDLGSGRNLQLLLVALLFLSVPKRQYFWSPIVTSQRGSLLSSIHQTARTGKPPPTPHTHRLQVTESKN